MVNLTIDEWNSIRHRLMSDYAGKPSIFLIRESMKRELGFTPRFHSEWTAFDGYKETVMLDFYNENAETFFRMKYL